MWTSTLWYYYLSKLLSCHYFAVTELLHVNKVLTESPFTYFNVIFTCFIRGVVTAVVNKVTFAIKQLGLRCSWK